MTSRRKPKVDPDQARKLIAEADARDLRRARLSIKAGVRAAETQWIAAPVIAEALTLELMTVLKTDRSGAEGAALLRSLARAFESSPDIH